MDGDHNHNGERYSATGTKEKKTMYIHVGSHFPATPTRHPALGWLIEVCMYPGFVSQAHTDRMQVDKSRDIPTIVYPTSDKRLPTGHPRHTFQWQYNLSCR
jgi:hypothetical protein